jgi:hypothetical protein
LTLYSTTGIGNFVDLFHGTLANRGSLTVNPGSTGVATLTGAVTNYGTLTLRSGTLAATGTYTQAAGTTNVLSGTHLNLIYTTRSITASGGVFEGSGTIGGGLTNTGATVKPGGTAVGTLRIAGAYTQGSGGHLAIDLAATSRDLLAVTGAVSLRGYLAAHNVGTYRPAIGAKYRVLLGGSIPYFAVTTTSSGTGTTTAHWVASHTTTGGYLTWRNL